MCSVQSELIGYAINTQEGITAEDLTFFEESDLDYFGIEGEERALLETSIQEEKGPIFTLLTTSTFSIVMSSNAHDFEIVF